MNDKDFQELASLFFTTRQIIRQKIPNVSPDPNAWLRFETLRYIAKADGPTMHDVAKYLRVKAPSATSFVANLVRRGLLRRKDSVRDKRIVRIYLTGRGTRALVAHNKRSVGAMREAFSGFSADETLHLARILRHLRDIHRA